MLFRSRLLPRLFSFVLPCIAAGGGLVWAAGARMALDGHEVHIREVMAGANGDSRAQFLVIRQEGTGQNLWGPQSGEAQSRAMLVFYDAGGRETGIYKFPVNPPAGGSLDVLVATAEFAALLGAPTPDIVIPPLLNALNGKVCFKANPATDGSAFTECLSYGGYTGATESNSQGGGVVAAGTPAPALPVLDTVSLRRTSDTGRNADFQLVTAPTPTNIAGATATLFVDPQTVQGERLFTLETFGGNGRTCSTCHVPSQSFGLQPFDVQARFLSVATTYDPLFVAEVSPSAFAPADPGFDYNLNTLTLTAAVQSAAPCTGELRGIITSAASGGRAKVIARMSSTTYLIGGGFTPLLSGVVTDGTCDGTVASVAPGTLGAAAGAAIPGLEDPRWLRMSRTTTFPDGRALFLENVDVLTLDNVELAVDPRVFRKSPHLLNLNATGPYGFSGLNDLNTFAAGAVKQHNPRTLVRSSGGASPDFRLPTQAELDAMEAFQRAQEFPSGTDPDKYNLDRFATTPAAIRGRAFFFGDAAKCSRCHGGPTLSSVTGSALLDQAVDTNGRFDTGIENQTLSGTAPNIVPCELGGVRTAGNCAASRKFSTPQLFNVKHLGPYFHDSSAVDLRTAIAFYNSPAFDASEAGRAIGGISLPSPANNCAGATVAVPCTIIPDIQAFLESLVMPSITRNSAMSQTALAGGAPAALPSVIVRDDDGVVMAGVTVTFASTAGGGTVTGASAVTNASGVATVTGWTLGAGLNTMTASLSGATGSPVSFNVLGTVVSPAVTTQPAAQSVNAAATLSFTAAASGSPAPSIVWQVSVDSGSTWNTLTNTSPYSGATTGTLTITGATAALDNARYRAVATNAGGTVNTAAAALTVYGGATITPSTLRFSATKAGASGALTAVTAPQTVLIAFAGTASGWTMAADQPWVQVTGGSGAGNGIATLAIVDPSNLIGGSTSLTATVTLTPARSGLPVVTVPLSLTVAQTSAAGAVPFGIFDTPIHNSTVSSVIAVTGWALDDVGIDRVEIWRDLISNDPAPPFHENGHPADGKVFVATGAFVEGSRPDVEAIYTTTPARHRAGWGYLLLTQGLPNQNGTFVLTAIAWDKEGQPAVLGTKTIVVNNVSATKPFGSIDVPAYGATFSGHQFTFGWALTPGSGCSVAGGQQYMTIDSAPPNFPITYGANRPDIAATFPGLADSTGAGGAVALDSRTYVNGTHQIGWLVYDSCGNGDGIGSRFFTILNTGSDAAGRMPAADARPPALRDVIEGRGPTFDRVGHVAGPVTGAPDALWLVRGMGTRPTVVSAGAAVWLTQTGRIEVHVTEPVFAGSEDPASIVRYEGYLAHGGVLRPLPLGSSFDAARGSFYWQPVAGFLGTYELRILRLRGDSIEAAWSVPLVVGPDADRHLLQIDRAEVGGGTLRVEGWALDPQAAGGSGIAMVHVWGTRRGPGVLGSGGPEVQGAASPVFLGSAGLGGYRPDVGDSYGRQFDFSGYSLSTGVLDPGEYEVVVYAWSLRTAAWAIAKTVTLTIK